MTHIRIRPFNTRAAYPEQQLDNDLCQAVVAGGVVYLRGQIGQDLDTSESVGIGDVEVAGSEQVGPGAWRVRLRTATGALFEADVAEDVAEEPAYLTCCADEPKRARLYAATALRTLTAA